MPRSLGDKNYSAREQRLAAELAAEKTTSAAKFEALKKQIKVKDARLKELKRRLKG